MHNYTIKQLADITNAKIIGNKQKTIKYLIYDSRMTIPAEESLFIAIKTKTNDGHNFIQAAYNKGYRNFLISNFTKKFENLNQANFIIVNDTLVALHQIAQFHRKQFKNTVIGITGSNGKTIVKEWLTQSLNKNLKVYQSPKSYNSQLGVPISIWGLSDTYDIAIIEAGISLKNEMDKLEKIILPQIGIITNIGDAHQENFNNINEKLNEKLKLFKNSEIIIFPNDYEIIKNAILKTYPNKKTFCWGKNKNSDLQIINISKYKKSSEILLNYKAEKYTIKLNYTDKASIENILTVLSTLLLLNKKSNPDDYDFSSLQPVQMRLQQIEGKNSCTIINDSYNCDLTSLRIALDVLNSQNQHKNKTLILSDIVEIGSKPQETYSTVAKLIKNSKINKLIAVGEQISKYKNIFDTQKFFFNNTDELLRNIEKLKLKNETILIKGARKYHFEKISTLLQLKNHRTVLEINMAALEHNLQYFRTLINPQTKLMIMVKAFSYGNGSFEIANFLQRKNIDYLAVAIADEGIELRKAGIKTPILILNPDAANFDIFYQYQLEPEIYNFRMLKLFYNTIKNHTYMPYPIHLKINTGMNRLGFDENEIDNLLALLKQMPKIFVKSIFSHLVATDDKNLDYFTLNQIKKYQKISNYIEKNIKYKTTKHILNSAGIERFPQYQFDMVRLGIGLYGLSAINNSLLKNISSLKTKIIQIREIKAGETVGYNRSWTAKRTSKIATIPIGYADGLNRKLSNRVGEVMVNGAIVPIVGNICMDLSMIDVTDINAEEGDEVIIFGNKYPINKIAKKLNTIPYEILTSISQRVKRVYVWE
jgi:alanine racemase